MADCGDTLAGIRCGRLGGSERNKGERVSVSETHKEEAIAAHSNPADACGVARGQRVRCESEDEDVGMAILLAGWMTAREV